MTSDEPSAQFWVKCDADHVVTSFGHSDVVEDSALTVPAEVYAAVAARHGLAKFDGTSVTNVDLPLPPSPPMRVLKVDIWRRATNAEAETLVSLLGGQPVRLQRMFNDATVISSADDFWPMLSGAIANALGVNRAAELLAPSE